MKNFTNSENKCYVFIFNKTIFTIVFLILISFQNDIMAQTVHISPTGSGGFESGTTFASNGWSNTSGSSNRNQWVVSTGATGYSGNRCAYVSDDTSSSPPPHNYNITTTRRTHFYRDITIASGESEITLSFSWKANGQSGQDMLKVWSVPTSYTPIFGTAINATGSAPTGRILVGSYLSQSSWTTETVNLSTAYAGETFRLVFEWINNNNTGTQTPAAVDNISLISNNGPSNDDCSGAITLTVNPDDACTIVTSGDTEFATESMTGCSGNADDDLWYKFVATSTNHTITATPGTMSNIMFEVFENSCGSLSSLVCRNITSGSSSEVFNLNGLTIGNTYFVRVYSVANITTRGTFSLCVTTNPTNDHCNNPTALTVNSDSNCTVVTNSSTVNATQSFSGCNGTADDDVWFSFIATSSSHTVTVTPGTIDNLVFQVYSGSCNSLSSIICRNATTGSNVETTTLTSLTVGNTYFVRVYSNANGSSQGTFSICITTLNDNCPDATVLTANSGSGCIYSSDGTTLGATQSLPGCSGSAEDDVWYEFVATSTTHNVIVTPGTLYDAVLQVYSGSCGSLSSLICRDVTINYSPEIASLTGLTIGNTYYVRVYGYYNGYGGTFNICVTTPENPCSSITAITTCGQVNSLAIPSGSGIQSSSSCGVSTPGIEYIYSFTPPMSGTFEIEQLSAGSTISYQYKEASLGCNLSSWMCIQNLTGTVTSYTFYMSEGVQYYFMIDPLVASGTSVSFRINCLTAPCSAGDGIGTAALGCPSVQAGGLGLSGASPTPIECDAVSTCTTLEASYLKLGQTTTYKVESITYAPPYQFNCLTNPVSVNIDDVWSDVINLPFSFCFFGNTYNSCLIGSNGTLTFDISNPSGYAGWQFSNNLPSTVGALFNNTIYGVYHDIDPSKGGTVGWELITLTTGCRALVASWSEIPMYSDTCNDIIYTGMMVLYEDSNVIEVYIKEKNVCNSWNGGNAVVGIQNASGTTAIVAPNRNSLDTNWTVSTEAWRFVPDGIPVTTIEWFEGSGTSGPLIATTDTIDVCPTETTTYTARVSYTLCNGSTIVETDETEVKVNVAKIWDGSVNNDWDDVNNWTPVGIPTIDDCVIIPVTPNNPVIQGTNYEALGKNLSILNGASLTLNSENNIKIAKWVDVNAGASFVIENNGSLIQIDNSTNTGNITYKRSTSIRKLDYVYWSSPVSNFHVNAVSTGTPSSGRYFWNTTVANTNGGIGNWNNANEIMIPGKGYIVRGPNSFNTTPQLFTATFVGTPNNGNISIPISRGTYEGIDYSGTNGVTITNMDDNFNLIGNPYPSAIHFTDFMAANPELEGSIRVWTHGTLPSNATGNPFYGSFAYNYTSNDYIIHNGTGTISGPDTYDGYIPAGQSFFVAMLDGPATTSSANFTNSMRVKNQNTQFYRNSNTNSTENSFGNSRIWLDLVSNNSVASRILVGYINGATNEKDRMFDAYTKIDNPIVLYSLINTEKACIQGKGLPFEDTDVIPLGFKVSTNAEFTIAIAAVDGIFNHEQTVFLKDKLLNVIHNLTLNPYTFMSDSGVYNERFEIVYTNTTLGVNEYTTNDIKVITNDKLTVYSSLESIKEIIVYDVLGRKINEYKSIQSNEFTLEEQRNNQGLILKITLENDVIVNKKILF